MLHYLLFAPEKKTGALFSGKRRPAKNDHRKIKRNEREFTSNVRREGRLNRKRERKKEKWETE